jgi:hypothetical protein
MRVLAWQILYVSFGVLVRIRVLAVLCISGRSILLVFWG